MSRPFLCVALILVASGVQGEAAGVDFEGQVRPIFKERCIECHGEEKQKGRLQLDSIAGILRGGESGEPLFVSGKSAESHFLKRVASADKKDMMPPKGERLTTEQMATLRQWVDEGAKMPGMEEALASLKLKTDHWSFQPVKRPAVPKSGDAWVRGEIDEFIIAKLREKGLASSPMADKAILIRRLYLVMHGLPPSPQEVNDFQNDAHPDAWVRLVDRVLASPRYGERWARHWLDVVRYAESNGFETNHPRTKAWHYRDFVVEAFNSDKPYDQFIR
ncbi:MAG: DUF1549 domain-containing protein, partial [Verrucomicrobiaceae bacterium]